MKQDNHECGKTDNFVSYTKSFKYNFVCEIRLLIMYGSCVLISM